MQVRTEIKIIIQNIDIQGFSFNNKVSLEYYINGAKKIT